MAIYDIDGNKIGGVPSAVSVTDFGAKGDGTTNDATAIQNALSSLSENGGTINFPVGIYLITQPLRFYSNQILMFENGATILQGASINNLMRNYSTTDITGYNGTHDTQIIGATFDGGEYTTNNTLLGCCHSKNITIRNCKFKNAYGSWHDIEVNSSQYVLIENCDFDGSRKTDRSGENLQLDVAGNAGYYPWGDINIDGTACQYIEIRGCHFHNNTISPAIGNHSSGSHNFTRIHDCVFTGNTGERGAVSFNGGMSNLDVYNNTFNGCTTGIGTSNATYYICNNRFVGATTAISGTASVAHGNMINGTYTA